MANIVITSTPTTMLVVFNDAADHLKIKRGSYRRNEISEVLQHTDNEHITLIMLDDSEFNLSFSAAAGVGIVDSIDGNPLVNNDDLFTKLIVLQQV